MSCGILVVLWCCGELEHKLYCDDLERMWCSGAMGPVYCVGLLGWQRFGQRDEGSNCVDLADISRVLEMEMDSARSLVSELMYE